MCPEKGGKAEASHLGDVTPLVSVIYLHTPRCVKCTDPRFIWFLGEILKDRLGLDGEITCTSFKQSSPPSGPSPFVHLCDFVGDYWQRGQTVNDSTLYLPW